MPKIDIASAHTRIGAGYPRMFLAGLEGRAKTALGDAGGLTQFGVNLTRLPPGCQSALCHWHEKEDEFVYVLQGELMLIEEDGETRLGPGDAAAFKAGVAKGHLLVNRAAGDALYLEIGTRDAADRVHYPHDDLLAVSEDGRRRFTRKDGTAHPA